jgi:hypothetical protein
MKPMLQLQGGHGGMAATPELESSIQRLRGSGQPLADTVREPMERAFGADFSGVKVHTDAQSDQLNQSIQAKAFTTGGDIFFREGAYDPQSRGGQELIAHELTHVVQQTGNIQCKFKFKFKTKQSWKDAVKGTFSRNPLDPMPNEDFSEIKTMYKEYMKAPETEDHERLIQLISQSQYWIVKYNYIETESAESQKTDLKKLIEACKQEQQKIIIDKSPSMQKKDKKELGKLKSDFDKTHSESTSYITDQKRQPDSSFRTDNDFSKNNKAYIIALLSPHIENKVKPLVARTLVSLLGLNLENIGEKDVVFDDKMQEQVGHVLNQYRSFLTNLLKGLKAKEFPSEVNEALKSIYTTVEDAPRPGDAAPEVDQQKVDQQVATIAIRDILFLRSLAPTVSSQIQPLIASLSHMENHQKVLRAFLAAFMNHANGLSSTPKGGPLQQEIVKAVNGAEMINSYISSFAKS